jgi:hypothetical protein
MPKHAIPAQKIDIPGSNKKLRIEVDVIPANDLHASMRKMPNVTKVSIGGKPFFLVAGKTHVVA